MKLRKDQRYSIYCIMLAEAQSKNKLTGRYNSATWRSTDSGFCLMCEVVFGHYDLYCSLNELIFMESRNINRPVGRYFKFCSWYERRLALIQSIKETENF